MHLEQGEGERLHTVTAGNVRDLDWVIDAVVVTEYWRYADITLWRPYTNEVQKNHKEQQCQSHIVIIDVMNKVNQNQMDF